MNLQANIIDIKSDLLTLQEATEELKQQYVRSQFYSQLIVGGMVLLLIVSIVFFAILYRK